MGFQRLGAVELGWLKQLRAIQNEHRRCRWIEDDPRGDKPYCGAPVKPGSSYCAAHHERAYSKRKLKPISLPKNLQ